MWQRSVKYNARPPLFHIVVQQALVANELSLGEHHPKTTETRNRLIALLHALEQYEQAAQLVATQAEP